MKSTQTRLTLLGIALGVLLALLIAPQTCWLVRLQIAPGLINDTQSRRQFVQTHPNDYQIQLGGQMDYETQTQLDYARSLVPRFPNNPSLRANILRYATMKDIHMNREDADGALLSGKPDPPITPDPNNPPATPAQLAAFDADAAAGERLDPDNAYFPFMRAIGLFAAHRDAEALAAVTRAGAKPVWREYYEDEVEGHWRILDAVNGHREAMGSTAIFASVMFPHLGPLRAVARLVTVKAVLEELAGHREEGLTQRRSLAHCGDLMRAQGTTFIANLVGISISAISRTRPGGAAPIKADPNAPTSPQIREQRVQKQLDAYCAYVTRLGHPDAAREARAQAAASEQVRHRVSIDSAFLDSRFQNMLHLGIILAAGWVLVSTLALLGLLGLAAWGLGRLPRLRDRQPLPAGTTAGVWFVLILSLMGVWGVAQADTANAVLILAVLFLIPLAAFSLYAFFQPAFRRSFGQAALAGGLTLAALTALFGLAAWQMHGVNDPLATWNQMMPSAGSDSNNPPSAASLAQTQIFIGMAFAAALPLLLIIVFSIAARVRRVPVSVGLVTGFRAWIPALLCALTLLYAGLTLWTVRQEDRVNYDAERSLHGEGQYLAELSGQPWPGPVP